MRCFLTVPLVVASLAGYVYGHRHAPLSGLRRKSLGFGPEHPHAVFRSSPYQIQTNGFLPPDPSLPAVEVARLFIEDLLVGRPEGSSYEIRKDSYTDKSTGVTHVYVRQLVNGLEVADGDMNINVKGGMVISYGNSVCRLLHVTFQLLFDHNLWHSSTTVLFPNHSRTKTCPSVTLAKRPAPSFSWS